MRFIYIKFTFLFALLLSENVLPLYIEDDNGNPLSVPTPVHQKPMDYKNCVFNPSYEKLMADERAFVRKKETYLLMIAKYIDQLNPINPEDMQAFVDYKKYHLLKHFKSDNSKVLLMLRYKGCRSVISVS